MTAAVVVVTVLVLLLVAGVLLDRRGGRRTRPPGLDGQSGVSRSIQGYRDAGGSGS